MSEIKHTPAPWNTCHNGDCSCGSINSEHFPIAITVGKNNAEDAPYVSDDERKANAKLIAAAPELLEACQAVVNANLDWNVINKMVMEAIKKATG